MPAPLPRDATRERHEPRPDDAPAVAARQRMDTEEAKLIYKERAATMECVNAEVRNRGLQRFLVRGIDKAVSQPRTTAGTTGGTTGERSKPTYGP